MAEPVTYDLGLVDSVIPEATGKPGERTFKITARSSRGRATVWMEKEQLFQIGISIKQFTAARPAVRDPARFVPEGPAPEPPVEIEFKAGDMSLRHDAASDVFTLSAANFADDEGDDGPRQQREQGQAVQALVSLSRTDAEQLADRVLEVVAAGRRPCPLCGAPLDAGGPSTGSGQDHFCVRKNGYRKQES